MKNSKNILIYSALAIVASGIAYFFITKKSDNIIVSDGLGVDSEGSPIVTTNSGTDILAEQTVIPSQLSSILEMPLTTANKLLKNKNLYTKLDNVKARQTASVNNGVLNNEWGVITSKGTFIGKVIEIVEDTEISKNSKGRTYRWFKVNLSTDAIDSIIKSPKEHLVHPNLVKTQTYPAYLREDTLIIK